MSLPKISVIGLGRLGAALTKTLCARNIPVKSVFNRSPEKAEELAVEEGINLWGELPETIQNLGNLVFITVADRAIEEVAGRLSKLESRFQGRTFVHCSGNESAALLDPLKSKGATVASFHPLQTFTRKSAPDDFNDIYVSLQGDSKAFPLLKKVAKQLGAHTLEVTSEQKSHLHAAAVMASNYLVTLLNASTEIGVSSGLSDSKVKKALLPLVKTTLKNTEQQSFLDALTGPIKRGDIETVQKHLALLEDQDELKSLYCMLGLHTVKLIESEEKLDAARVAKLRRILS